MIALIGMLALLGQAQAQSQEGREAAIARAAQSMRDRLVLQRRDFHMHPELSNREERTAKAVADRLRALGYEVKTGVGRNGVVGILHGKRPGATVAVRADMDALPINEVNDVPYRSQTPNVKHACGHDVHTTVELGLAEVLAGMRDELAGTVELIFQGAEEGPPAGEKGGAPMMIEEGVLRDWKPRAIFALHVVDMEVGKVGLVVGPALASADHFTITIHGKKTHAGQAPQNGIDAVVVASEAVLALQTVRSRRIDPVQPMVLSVSTIQGGNRWNIMADEVRMEGTVRALDEKVRARTFQVMRETLAGVTSIYGASYELQNIEGGAVTVNDPALAEEMIPALKRSVGETNFVRLQPEMGAEDFSYFAQQVPGFYFRLGVSNAKKGIVGAIHTPTFDADEESLVVGVRTMATLVTDYLERHAGR